MKSKFYKKVQLVLKFMKLAVNPRNARWISGGKTERNSWCGEDEQVFSNQEIKERNAFDLAYKIIIFFRQIG